MADYETRTVKKMLCPAGADLFSERATTVEIEDEGGGEFVVVRQYDAGRGGLSIDAPEWPTLRKLIDEMVAECREPESEAVKAPTTRPATAE